MYFKSTKHNMLKKMRGSMPYPVKVWVLSLCFCAFALLAHAQHAEARKPVPLNPQKDKIEYQNFTIRLVPTTDGYYGFDVLQGGKLVLHQAQNPFPEKGLTVKEDAFFTAKWMISEYQKNGQFPRVFPPGFQNQFPSSQPR